jgi:hypothetical protein
MRAPALRLSLFIGGHPGEPLLAREGDAEALQAARRLHVRRHGPETAVAVEKLVHRHPEHLQPLRRAASGAVLLRGGRRCR